MKLWQKIILAIFIYFIAITIYILITSKHYSYSYSYSYGKEGFALRPASVDRKLLLDNDDPEHKPKPELSCQSYSTQYVNYPVFPADSMHSNNIRYWKKPTNGQCAPPELCGKVYDKKHINKPIKIPNPGFNCRRVNFYNVY